MRESYTSKIDALRPSFPLSLSLCRLQHILGTLTRSHQRHFPMLVQLVVAQVFTKSEQTCILAASLLQGPTTTRQSSASASAVSRAEVNDLSRVTITISSWHEAIMNEQVPLFFDQRKKLVATFCEPKCFFDRTFECVSAFFFIHFILFFPFKCVSACIE